MSVTQQNSGLTEASSIYTIDNFKITTYMWWEGLNHLLLTNIKNIIDAADITVDTQSRLGNGKIWISTTRVWEALQLSQAAHTFKSWYWSVPLLEVDVGEEVVRAVTSVEVRLALLFTLSENDKSIFAKSPSSSVPSNFRRRAPDWLGLFLCDGERPEASAAATSTQKEQGSKG